MEKDPYILVIGGTNMDIGARPFGPLLPHDSLPGTVRRTPGGVGRNIAVTLAQLGHKVKMLTAMCLDGIPPSSYIFVEDNKGDIQWAVCDASASDQIDKEYISLNEDVIRGASAVLLDTNPPADAIACAAKIASDAGVPLFVDPISAAKAAKVSAILPYTTVLKPNKQEAETLCGRPILTMANAEDAVISLLGLGVKEVYLTLGKKGVVAGAAGQDLIRLPGFALHPVNTSGCGDAFVSAVLHAFLQGDSLRDKARAGVAAASISMETKSAVNPILTADALQERMKLVD